MRALLESLLLAFWENEVSYLDGREVELKAEKARIDRDINECVARKKRAEMRQLQYARPR